MSAWRTILSFEDVDASMLGHMTYSNNTVGGIHWGVVVAISRVGKNFGYWALWMPSRKEALDAFNDLENTPGLGGFDELGWLYDSQVRDNGYVGYKKLNIQAISVGVLSRDIVEAM